MWLNWLQDLGELIVVESFQNKGVTHFIYLVLCQSNFTPIPPPHFNTQLQVHDLLHVILFPSWIFLHYCLLKLNHKLCNALDFYDCENNIIKWVVIAFIFNKVPFAKQLQVQMD